MMRKANFVIAVFAVVLMMGSATASATANHMKET